MMEIRQAQPGDYPAIYQHVQQAFKTAQVSDGTEQDFVEALRKKTTFIPELEFVAVEEGKIIGHVMLSEQEVKTEDTHTRNFLLLAPLSVDFNYRNQKIGGALMETAFKKAVALERHAVFLVENPDYYSRYGFSQIQTFGLKNKSTIPDQFILGQELVHGVLADINGELEIKE
ncbi:GNAT family N-acetyltransferase [Enterococcus sp. SMC-9]|uniref:GNAT family N-acetyltransferase n=1 Tax=Enterococcus sp. SMC-9 TaxID=2862343 RepID=UPI001E283805|nr:N-acetyltransferase [Enterococcus sp. SMC-9]